MEKIEFKNAPNTETPLSAENLNKIQENIENEILAKREEQEKINSEIDSDILAQDVEIENIKNENALQDGKIATLENENKDTGWIDLSPLFASGITTGSISGKLEYRKKGNAVFIQGDVQGLSQAGRICENIPEEIRPKTSFYNIGTAQGTTLTRIYVTSEGNIGLDWTLDGTYNKTWYSVDLSYMV